MEIDWVNAIQERDASQLIKLIENTDQSALESIIAKLSAFPAIGSTTLLHWTAELHSLQLAKLLISKNPYKDLNAKDDSGATCLHWACGEGMLEIANLFLDKGADFHAVDFGGESPLHWAALNGHPECIELLLDRGATPNKQADNGCTPLHLATLNRHGKCISTLLDRGAEPEIKDKQGRTPRQVAESKGWENIVDYFSSDKRKSIERITSLESEIVKLKAELHSSKKQIQSANESHEETTIKLANVYKEQMTLEQNFKELQVQLEEAKQSAQREERKRKNRRRSEKYSYRI